MPDFDNSIRPVNSDSESSHLSSVQAKYKSSVQPSFTPAHLQKKSSGKLPAGTKEKMEGSFNEDFSDVDIHKDSTSAENLKAKAFTKGKSIHFAPGEFQPESKEGQKLIGHELTHVVQQKENKVASHEVTGKGIEVNSDPSLEKEADEMGEKASRGENVTSISSTSSDGAQRAVDETATDYRDYANLSAMTLGDLDGYAKKQADWHASPLLSGADRDNIRAALSFGREPEILSGCSGMKVSDMLLQISAHGLADMMLYITTYSKSVSMQDPFELKQLTDVAKAYETGKDLSKLKGAFPGYVLKTALRETEFYQLQTNKYIDELIQYYTNASPHFSADNGADFRSYNTMRTTDKVNPENYFKVPLKGNVKNFHRFEKKALDKLEVNFNDTSKTNPLTLILHTAHDHNGAFHRDPKLTQVIEDKTIHTIMIEGKEKLEDVKDQIDPLAKKYGKNDKIDQVMIAGHGNARSMQLAGTIKDNGKGELEETQDRVSLMSNQVKTDDLFNEILGHMDDKGSKDLQKHRRIVFNACLTNSNAVRAAITSNKKEDAKKEIIAYINANASLATYMQNMANAKNKDVKSIGSNASFGSIGLIDPVTHSLDLTSTKDPKLTAPKNVYVEFGTEPSGALRAVLETWAKDEKACVTAMTNRVKKTSTDWDGIIIETLYSIILSKYLDQGEQIRKMSLFADEIAEFKFEARCRPEKITFMDSLGADYITVTKALKNSAEWKARTYIPLVLMQGWMTADPSDATVKSDFLALLSGSFTCQSARKFVGIDYLTAKGHIPKLLATKNDGAMMLALLGVLNPTMNADCKAYLISELNSSDRFDPAKKVGDKLAGLGTEDQILVKIGKLVIPDKSGTNTGSVAANVDANLQIHGDTKNKEYVSSVTYKGLIKKSPDTEVFSDAAGKNAVGKLSEKTNIYILGDINDKWAIEFDYKGKPGTAFVAKADVTTI